MPKDDINYRFKEPSDTSSTLVPGVVYDFYDVFVPAELFRRPSLWTWGSNSNGRLGVNDTTNRQTPVTTILGGTNWKTSGSGYGTTFAIKTDGTLWTWGNNGYGGIGINDTNDRSTPVTTILGGTNWKYIEGGFRNIAAIKTDGTLWCWGRGVAGELGINALQNRSTPVTTFAGGNDWKSVSCGDGHVGAIKTDGTLWIWGNNVSGQLGVNDTSRRLTPITTILGGTDWKSISCGSAFSAAIKTDGTLWVWGRNDNGNLGIGSTITVSTPVTTILGGTNWKQVSCGKRSFSNVGPQVAAIKTDGTLWTWGLNDNGQLGINDTLNRSTPVTTILGGTNWKQVSSGTQIVTAVKTDGTLWIWGDDSAGSLGNGSSGDSFTPITTTLGGNNWKSVFTFNEEVLAIEYEPDP